MNGPAQSFAKPPARIYNSHAARALQENMDDSLIAATEFNWREAARESERRIVANHYSPVCRQRLNRLPGRPIKVKLSYE